MGECPSFFISTLDEGEWSASRTCRFTPEETASLNLLDGMFCGPQSQLGGYGEEKK
jgi:hypothetical protein